MSIPMPARERFYPGTGWTVADLPEVPLEIRGLEVLVFTELQQDEDDDFGEPGDLYTWVYPKDSDPISSLHKVYIYCLK